jgi:hypothetical protein
MRRRWRAGVPTRRDGAVNQIFSRRVGTRVLHFFAEPLVVSETNFEKRSKCAKPPLRGTRGLRVNPQNVILRDEGSPIYFLFCRPQK